jgi:hypothetical protein
LGDDQFKIGFAKFADWLKLLCVPLNNGVFNYNRIMDLFNLKQIDGTRYTLKHLQRLVGNCSVADIKSIVNQILRPVGLFFRSQHKRTQVKGVRTSTQVTTLQLIYPVLLNYYIEPEPNSYITKKKLYLQLDKWTIPVLSTDGIPKMSDAWLDLYKSSVFYHLPQVYCTSEDDKSSNDTIDKSDD